MILFLSWIIFSVVVASIASSRGRSAGSFFLLSLLLSPLLAGIVLFATKPTREEAERVAIRGGDIKRCPHCAELVKIEAIICKHCRQPIPTNTPVRALPPPVLPVTRQMPTQSSEPWTATSRALAALVVVLAVTVVVLHLTH